MRLRGEVFFFTSPPKLRGELRGELRAKFLKCYASRNFICVHTKIGICVCAHANGDRGLDGRARPATLVAKALWSAYLRTTVYSNGTHAYDGAADKDALQRTIEERFGRGLVRLIGDEGAVRSYASRKEALSEFSKYLSTLSIKERPKSDDKQAFCLHCGRIARANATATGLCTSPRTVWMITRTRATRLRTLAP